MSQRIAYVTGGMGGIGTGICQRLAKQGFKVVAGCGPNSPRRAAWLEQQKALGYAIDDATKRTADAPPDAPAADDAAPNIFTALQEQLGLKLDPGRGYVDVIIIDHVEKPSPN